MKSVCRCVIQIIKMFSQAISTFYSNCEKSENYYNRDHFVSIQIEQSCLFIQGNNNFQQNNGKLLSCIFTFFLISSKKLEQFNQNEIKSKDLRYCLICENDEIYSVWNFETQQCYWFYIFLDFITLKFPINWINIVISWSSSSSFKNYRIPQFN